MSETVVQMPGTDSAPPVPSSRFHEVYLQILCAWDVFNARLLLGMALLGGIAMWAFEVYWPSFDRLLGAVGYSVLVIIPLIVLAHRKG